MHWTEKAKPSFTMVQTVTSVRTQIWEEQVDDSVLLIGEISAAARVPRLGTSACLTRTCCGSVNGTSEKKLHLTVDGNF